jgi:hypothetical protein
MDHDIGRMGLRGDRRQHDFRQSFEPCQADETIWLATITLAGRVASQRNVTSAMLSFSSGLDP